MNPQTQKILSKQVSESRSYLMMLVSSLMEIQKIQKETKTSFIGNLDQALEDLAMLDEVLEQTQGEK
jgi:hypothetical protein